MIRDRNIAIDVDNWGDTTTVAWRLKCAQRVTGFMLRRVQSDGHASQVRHWRVCRTYRRVMKENFREMRYILNEDYVENAHTRVQDHDIDIDEDID